MGTFTFGNNRLSTSSDAALCSVTKGFSLKGMEMISFCLRDGLLLNLGLDLSDCLLELSLQSWIRSIGLGDGTLHL
jgi:hypothetical protein